MLILVKVSERYQVVGACPVSELIACFEAPEKPFWECFRGPSLTKM